MAVINDKELVETIIEDLQTSYEYSKAEADEWIAIYGDNLVDAMWTAYTDFICKNAECKGME